MKIKLSKGSTVMITDFFGGYEIINGASGKTIAGTLRHIERIREKAISKWHKSQGK